MTGLDAAQPIAMHLHEYIVRQGSHGPVGVCRIDACMRQLQVHVSFLLLLTVLSNASGRLLLEPNTKFDVANQSENVSFTHMKLLLPAHTMCMS